MGNAEKTPAIQNTPPIGVGNLESFVSQIKNIDLNSASQDSLTDSLKSIFSCESATLLNYDDSKKELYSLNYRSHSTEEIRFQVSANNLAGFVAATRKPLNISDVHSIEELAKHDEDHARPDFPSRYAIASVQVQAHRALADLLVQDR